MNILLHKCFIQSCSSQAIITQKQSLNLLTLYSKEQYMEYQIFDTVLTFNLDGIQTLWSSPMV